MSLGSSLKKQTLIVVCSVVMISLLVVSVSYSSFSSIGIESSNYVVENFPVVTTIKGNKDNILNSNSFGNDISFSVANNSDLDVLYKVYLVPTDDEAVSSSSMFNISLDGASEVTLNSLKYSDNKYELVTGVLKSRNSINDSITHTLKVSSSVTMISYKLEVEANVVNDVASNVIRTLNDSSSIASVNVVENSGLLEDAFGNIRYFGSKPNNYIKINNEMWRIVGLFKTTDNNGKEDSLLKVIRDEAISSSKYYSDGKKSWDDSIGNVLNTKYSSNAYRSEKTKYYVGDFTSGKNYKGTDYYVNETSRSAIISNAGLLSVSDYYFASYDGVSGNWLNNGTDFWLMNVDFSSDERVYAVDNEGNVILSSVNDSHSIRPVLYLESTVRIIDGDGTVNSPYVID